MDGSVRVALVTGAGSGIGAAVAVALAEDGFRVALAGRRRAPLEETASGLDDALVIQADVTSPEEVSAAFREVEERWGRLDLLVNNAGVFGEPAPVEDVPYEQWARVIDTNLTGAFLCAQEAFRLMKRQSPQGGRIINNGSLSAHTPRPNAIAYTASKHAMTGLTKSLSLEGRRHGIACGQIDIGNAATDLAAGFGQGTLQADGSRRSEPLMDVRHAVDGFRYMASLPLDANVEFLTVMATTMPSFIGRG